MDSKARTLIKALTWQMLGVITMTALAYPQMGSIWQALALSCSASASGFVFFFVHERIWARVRWGRH